MATKNNNRNSVNLLPAFFRTDKNNKFLSSTLDQLIKSPALDRVDGYIGSKTGPSFNPLTDRYITEPTAIRQQYQLEPALVIKNIDQSIKKAFGYDDLLNQIDYFGGNTDNHDRLFRPVVNSYNPHIDWDKFVNFKEYYWMPTGPATVAISGLQKNTVSTFTVTDSPDGKFFMFTPDGLTSDPLVSLYRGNTYVFNVSNTTKTFYIKTSPELGTNAVFENVSGNGTKNGQVILVVDEFTPSVLFYQSSEDVDVGGRFVIKQPTENSVVNVDTDIIGKATYTSGNGVELVNGLKIKFVGDVEPAQYRDKEFVVEGVGTAIKLIDFTSLITPDDLATLTNTSFDQTPFDQYPFDDFKNIPILPEYVTINRASKDQNPWSRYNRWFHVDVLSLSAAMNGTELELPYERRAARPIIEFNADIQLWNFGTTAIQPVDLIDELTADAFSDIEKSTGYYVDQIKLEQDFRVVFANDLDPTVRNKVYRVNIATVNGASVIDLIEDGILEQGTAFLVTKGTKRRGTEWWFDGESVQFAQQRLALNQAPRFDLFDKDGISYSNSAYNSTEFVGNKVFGYKIGTGTNDPILGFPLKYKNDSTIGVGAYLFENYFDTETITLLSGDSIETVPSSKTYIRINSDAITLENIWDEATDYRVPVIQLVEITTPTNEIEITCFDNSNLLDDLEISIFINTVKQTLGVDYVFHSNNTTKVAKFVKAISSPSKVLVSCISTEVPNSNGTYETPINLTNNPLNGVLTDLTLSEITDHVRTMVSRSADVVGEFPGVSNLRNISGITKLGTRLISSQNPLAFAQYFLTDIENNAIDAIRSAANNYYNFKLNLINFISKIGNETRTIAEVVDAALTEMNANKTASFAYSQSDMLGYGQNTIVNTYRVSDPRNTVYPVSAQFDLTKLSNRSVLVYQTIGSTGATVQLTHGRDYVFATNDTSLTILSSLTKNDTIKIVEYQSTVGSFIPPTPTKLGLFPSYEPSIFVDKSFSTGPRKVIQGHDGSIIVAFSNVGQPDDFRDLAILEYELRVYNNLKTLYNSDLLNIHAVVPSVFRKTDYSLDETDRIIQREFIKWSSVYGVDFASHNDYDRTDYTTYNYSSARDYNFDCKLPGSWRAIYKFYFDTDRPNTHPWEMLGFSVKPLWWESYYGPAPYTAGNQILWDDLEKGLIRDGDRKGVDPVYARPGLSTVIPVDASGNIVDIRYWDGISKNDSIPNTDANWEFGNIGPAEAAWRRSSLWPFAVQIMLALTKPADYFSRLFDPSKMHKDGSGQYKSGDLDTFLDPRSATVFSNKNALCAGYSVWVVEHGISRSSNYVTQLSEDLSLANFNLFYKLAGFTNKDKIELIIDSVNPASSNPGVSLPAEDYSLIFNVSNPVHSLSISGMIVEKRDGYFVVKGYDRYQPYFTVKTPVYTTVKTVVTVGGKSEEFLVWSPNTLYQANQVVYYGNNYYRIIVAHNSGATFDSTKYKIIRDLPLVGGTSVYTTNEFSNDDTIVPYGVKFNTVQEVYDLIIGYGAWLESKGFTFDNYVQDLAQTVDWKFSGKEFLFWSTQNWSVGTVITLSPFANKLSLKFTDAVVDNVLDSFYEYSLAKADGQPFPSKNFSLSREGSVCTIETKNTNDGLYFARLNLVQKEHAIVFNNSTLFNDIIYDDITGYRQSRVKITGFKTADWNGDFESPGFIYDDAKIEDWQPYTDYTAAEVVKYAGKYYSALKNTPATENFEFSGWNLLGEKPVAQLLPNFDYKINQFEDFYSLDIDNFDVGQQKMAQHLVGYTPRTYLDNIFVDQIAQYKFYQGFIREKGTKNAITKLAKASVHNLHGQIDFNEEWAFRVGAYGNYTSYNELELPLVENEFIENSQIVKFVNEVPNNPNDMIVYARESNLQITPANFAVANAFPTSKSTFSDTSFVLPTAGYVKLDEVTATAVNKTSLFDIANNGGINEGDTVWLGFEDNGDWGVYRYTKQQAIVVGSEIATPGSVLRFNTSRHHRLNVGDVVSVYGLDNGTDGVYEVKGITSLTSFDVASSLTSINESTTSALLYKFVSVRASSFDDVEILQDTISFETNDIVWTDTDATGKWAVYQKTENYQQLSLVQSSANSSQQYHGSVVATSDNAPFVITSAPGYVSGNDHGRIFVYGVDSATLYPIVNYGINGVENEFYNEGAETGFGLSIAYNASKNVIFAGAPYASYVHNGGNVEKEGLVKISVINQEFFNEDTVAVIANPYATANSMFGSSVFAASNVLIVGAPGQYNSAGAVFVYKLDDNLIPTMVQLLDTTANETGAMLGTSIAGTETGLRIAVSAPNADLKGKVYVYTNLGNGQYSDPIVIAAPSVCKNGDEFGRIVKMSKDGTYLFVVSAKVSDVSNVYGKVFVYKWNNTTYVLNQTINNVSLSSDIIFGTSIDINDSADTLVIGAKGNKPFAGVVVDDNNTTFDGTNCTFGDTISGAGTVYVFNRYIDKFVYSEELFNDSVISGSRFGETVSINSAMVIIGAPGYESKGVLHLFDKKDPTANSWKLIRTQPDLIDLTKIERSILINTEQEQITDWIDIIDPVKGKIAGIADQEVRYKTAFDPAVYSIGTQGLTVDTETSWVDAHVGELWWDLSSVKYVWYEQDDLIYRKNSWGTIFPGASIDVYEWVKSEYLPSQWSSIADTSQGLTKGISGQPKYVDNSAISVQQYINSTTGSTTNVYYYWVKNKVTLPSVADRRVSAVEVARMIYDPAAYGLKTLSIIAPNAFAITNVKDSLVEDKMHLNIALNSNVNDVNKHTEWLLLEENSDTSMPNTLLEKKLFDSLLGRDSVGNPVPDPLLSVREKYGISIRPRQTMFKDKNAALRNLIDYTNSVLMLNPVTDNIDFSKLSSKEEIPDELLGHYDLIVETNDEFNNLSVSTTRRAELSCAVKYGKITEVVINDPGFGYKIAPAVEILGDKSGAIIKTEIDSVGKVTKATIVNAGKNFVEAPQISVRPFSAVIQIDATSNNKWAMYYAENNVWTKVRTQSFDTTAYWDFIDWSSANYDPLKPLAATVDQIYQLASLTLTNGDYVKVKNQGNGKFIILQKVKDSGSFSNEYDAVYREQGTIQFNDTIWNTSNSIYNFDYISTYDQTEYDQAPDVEISNVLHAIKDNIFVGALRVYWNKFFFKAVKYALTEQKSVDWAFKTSFINVRNLAGELAQRTTYKFQDSQYYEEYLNEVKPYKTKVRNFSVNYDVTEPSNTFTTDFDLPAVYDEMSGSFVSLDISSPLLQEYPYKAWADHYTMTVSEIVVTNSGQLYTTVPSVQIITAAGDTGTGATAEAYISAGKIYEIVVTNPGTGYTQTPTVIITGGNGNSAAAYARLTNNKVRAVEIGLRFDRVSKYAEIDTRRVSDSFKCNGVDYVFNLSWAAEYKKSDIVITINDVPALATDYEVDTYTAKYSPSANVPAYTKMYSRIVLNSVPNADDVLTVSYNKNINLYHAAERVLEFYTPTEGMPGNSLAQVMEGIEFGGTQFQTAPLSYNISWDTTPYGSVDWDSNDIDFDTVLDGGDLDYSTASGINPTDIIVDGDKFLSSNVGAAPEELVPGEVKESLGISVYTRSVETSPMIYNAIAEVTSLTESTFVEIGTIPPSVSSLMVTVNGQSLVYDIDYHFDYSTNVVEILPGTPLGTAGITVVGVSGSELLSSDIAVDTNASLMYVENTGPLLDVNSVYVTLNGMPLDNNEYQLTEVNGRARVTVNNLATGTTVLQAWFFRSQYKGFSEVKEQIIVATGTEQSTFTIDQVPGTKWSAGSQIIVELNKTRLIPYSSSYQVAVDGVTRYDIDPTQSRPAGVYDLDQIEVFVNDVKQQFGTDFFLDQENNVIEFTNITAGSPIVITNKVYSEFAIDGNQLTIRRSVSANDIVKITTFTNHDSLGLRTETFVASASNRFTISRPVASASYAWVSVAGRQLIRLQDYFVDSDNMTVVINSSVKMTAGDVIVISSVSSDNQSSVVGYRMFTDIFGRTTYRRLSKDFSTKLAAPLYIDSTTIEVVDSSVLAVPSPENNTPGVILIAGERIEYMQIDGNILSRIKRATLGTGARDSYMVGTAVVDQSPRQTLPYKDSLVAGYIITDNSPAYELSGLTYKAGSSFTFDNSIALEDQVEVYCGGKLLNKVSTVVHDNSIAYDSGEINSAGISSDALVEPQFTIDNNSIVLNVDDLMQSDKNLTVIQKHSSNWYVNNNASLIDDNSEIAGFLRDHPASLPDKYHYGQL